MSSGRRAYPANLRQMRGDIIGTIGGGDVAPFSRA